MLPLAMTHYGNDNNCMLFIYKNVFIGRSIWLRCVFVQPGVLIGMSAVISPLSLWTVMKQSQVIILIKYSWLMSPTERDMEHFTYLYILNLMGQYRHNQSRISTGHGIGVLFQDEHSDWKLCRSNGNMTLLCGVLFSTS